MIVVENLSKSYFVHKKKEGLKGSFKSLLKRDWVEKKALKEVSFELEQGEILGLVGANGAGKTTLVKILSGIIHPTSGSAKVLGHKPWDRNNELRKQIALIMGQKAQLWWDLPAMDCFLLLKEIYQISDEDYTSTIDELSHRLDVKDELNIQIRRLSLGERMKVELIAALLHKPKIIYLDEPTIGLDFSAQKAIRSFILEYREKYKPAMILTSHYMADIEQLCKRIIIIRDGEFVYDGALTSISSDYGTYRVLSIYFGGNAPLTREQSEQINKMGDVLETTESHIRIRIKKSEVPIHLSQIFKLFPLLKDVKIEEEDIADVIEKIMKNKK